MLLARVSYAYETWPIVQMIDSPCRRVVGCERSARTGLPCVAVGEKRGAVGSRSKVDTQAPVNAEKSLTRESSKKGLLTDEDGGWNVDGGSRDWKSWT